MSILHSRKVLRPIYLFIVVAFVLLTCSTAGFAADIIRDYTVIPATIDGHIYNLESMVYRPADEGIYPLIILNHGRSSKPEERKGANLVNYYKTQAETLAQKGFVVALVIRRGYGKSEGPDAEYSKPSTIFQAGVEGTKDVAEAVKFMQTKPYVDSKHTLVIGQSCGGLVAVASATKDIPGLIGVVNFAGGLRHEDAVNPNSWTSSDELYLNYTYSEYGKKAKVPMIWIYTENDSYFPPTLSPKMFEAFISGGGRGKFYLLPAFRTDGHTFFPNSSTIPTWMPPFEEFLNQLHLSYR